MAEDRMAVLDTVRKAIGEGDVDFLREAVRVLAQVITEAEVTELTGVPHGERDPERRLTRRNGYRERRWDTRVGTSCRHPSGPSVRMVTRTEYGARATSTC
jgi:transposase-like protein